MASKRHHLAYVDSLTRGKGHKGPSVISGLILSPEGIRLYAFSTSLTFATKYEAKYVAIITTAQKALTHGASHLVIFTDCQLIPKQFTKESRITKPHLKSYCQTLQILRDSFQGFQIVNIDQSLNHVARDLAASKIYVL